MEKWEEGFYITAMAGSSLGSSLVVMSKGTPYTQQSYKVSDSFPFKWINKKWKEGFFVTATATSNSRWAVVMSRNAGFVDQASAAHAPAPASFAGRVAALDCQPSPPLSLHASISPHSCPAVRGAGLPVPLGRHPPALGCRVPHHLMRCHARPGRLRAQRPQAPPHGRDAGDATHVRLP